MNKHFIQNLIYSGITTSILFLSACSSQVPMVISQEIKGSPTIAKIQEKSKAYLSQPVRWGGVIINTKNKQDTSRLTIVAYPLNNNGKPQITKNSVGRFIASINSFLEPQVYSRNRIITLTGQFIKTESIKVGDFPYNYPVIKVKKYFLWPDKKTTTQQPPVWRHEPFYWPYYPPHRH